MIAFGRNVPQEKRPLIFGVATAASSFGQFAFAPIGQGFISAFGWQSALVYLAAFLALALALTFALRGKTEQSSGVADLPFMQALSQAWGFGSYRLLVIGFFVCGFHLAFINVHMPAYLVQCGLSPEVGSWSIAIIGLFNIAGSLSAGYLGGKLPKQLLLSAIYFLRAVAIAGFVFFPVTPLTAYIFAAAIGFLWLSTVPLTAGLVSLFFGPRYMGMLYGVAFLSHQIGSFVGVWLGGYVYDTTGSYSLVWYLGILLGLASAAINFPIKDNVIDGNVVIHGWTGGWWGLIANTIGGNVDVANNRSVVQPAGDCAGTFPAGCDAAPGADTDAAEIQSRGPGNPQRIAGNLICHGNSPSVQINALDGGFPNIVNGNKIGECAGL